jgi:hypothetical protein
MGGVGDGQSSSIDSPMANYARLGPKNGVTGANGVGDIYGMNRGGSLVRDHNNPAIGGSGSSIGGGGRRSAVSLKREELNWLIFK